MSPAQEPLNRDPTVDVEVAGTASSELRNDLSGRPGHLFNNASSGRGQVDRATTQDHYALVTIWPYESSDLRSNGHGRPRSSQGVPAGP
jgi:hypothetical protein